MDWSGGTPLGLGNGVGVGGSGSLGEAQEFDSQRLWSWYCTEYFNCETEEQWKPDPIPVSLALLPLAASAITSSVVSGTF